LLLLLLLLLLLRWHPSFIVLMVLVLVVLLRYSAALEDAELYIHGHGLAATHVHWRRWPAARVKCFLLPSTSIFGIISFTTPTAAAAVAFFPLPSSSFALLLSKSLVFVASGVS
jgi:hypothetical protein